MADADLVTAARFELVQRGRHYPGLVASGKMTADDATVDFQAWQCLADFIETGTFRAVDCGGAGGDTVVGWPHAEAAAGRAVASTVEALEKAGGDPAKAQRLQTRVDALRRIFARVRDQRALVDRLNSALRADRQQRKAA